MAGKTKSGGMDANDAKKAGKFDPNDTEPATPPPAGNKAKPQVVDLERTAPTFAALYGADDLRKDRERKLLSLASLPPRPRAEGAEKRMGHGWGTELDRILGGGVHPGYMVGIGATHAGAGKTAFVMQLADGLALRTAELVRTKAPGPLTPVLVLSEMPASALTWRTLARWVDCHQAIFRAGDNAPEVVLQSGRPLEPQDVANAFADAEGELREGTLAESRQFLRLMANGGAGPALLEATAGAVNVWVDELRAAHPGREVWPVVVLDPIQRWQDTAKGEVEALNELVESLRVKAHAGGWIVFATSDTNKDSAKGKNEGDARERGTALFRGSYKLFHLLDAALMLTREEEEDGEAVTVQVIKNRWGISAPNQNARASYRWNPTRARYEPPKSEVRA